MGPIQRAIAEREAEAAGHSIVEGGNLTGHPNHAPDCPQCDPNERLTYLAFTPNHCSHCGADFNAHIPSGDRHVYYCPEWALRQKWGDR